MSSAMSLPLHSYNLPDDLLRFAHAIAEADGFAGDNIRQTTSNVLYFFEKPWKWETYYEAWKRYGCPSDASDPGWSEFCEVIDAD